VAWLQIRRDEFFPLRILGSLTAAGLAIADVIANEVDGSFFLLAGIAALVLTFPWQLLRTLKAGPFELSLEQGQVHGAVKSLAISADEPDDDAEKEFTDLLTRLQPDIERARGSRVLWVDDQPRRVVGERTLFRALGIETLVAISTQEAMGRLERDNDFDLVITSLAREGEKIAGDTVRPGVRLVQSMRGHEDEVIKDMPVIFYAAFPRKDLMTDTLPAVQLPKVEVSEPTRVELVKNVIRLLADESEKPVKVPPEKKVS
jgi:CheY-like chemotaxis protein